MLETVFHTASGAVALRTMPVVSEEDKRAALIPEHEVLREVEGLVGQVDLEVVYSPRPDYAGSIQTLSRGVRSVSGASHRRRARSPQ